jgi:hypothetical protein
MEVHLPITWNVAGTNTGTINTQNVTILLSKDGGLTFNTVLAASVPNNGSASVVCLMKIFPQQELW